MGAEQSKQLKRNKQNAKLIQNRINSTDNESNLTINSSQQSTSGTSTKYEQQISATDSSGHKIVVVSKGESQKDQASVEKEFLNYLYNHHFTPLLPKNQDTIPANYQQIDSISMTNLCKTVQNYLKEKSELSVKEQNLIYDKIKKIDYVTAFISNLVLEKERNQNKAIDVFNRLNDLKTLTQTYQKDLERCFKNIEFLNNLLDGDHRLDLVTNEIK